MPAILSTAGDARAIDPAYHAVAVTPSDTVDLTNVTTSIYVGGAGTMKVTTAGGDTVTYTGLLAGYQYRIRASRIWAGGTSATNIIAEWRDNG